MGKAPPDQVVVQQGTGGLLAGRERDGMQACPESHRRQGVTRLLRLIADGCGVAQTELTSGVTAPAFDLVAFQQGAAVVRAPFRQLEDLAASKIQCRQRVAHFPGRVTSIQIGLDLAPATQGVVIENGAKLRVPAIQFDDGRVGTGDCGLRGCTKRV